MPRCSFCKSNYEFPRGITVIQRDGTPRNYCASKCRKNAEMGRDNRRVKWVTKSVEAQEADKTEKKNRMSR